MGDSKKSSDSKSATKPIVIGIVGGVASGKSAVAEILSNWGARRLDADRIAHRVLTEEAVQQPLIARFGEAIRGPDGQILRGEIAKLVFGNTAEAVQGRAFLESVVHPRVKCELEQELAEATSAGTPMVILDVPLLLEVGWKKLVDTLIFVDTPTDVRFERVQARGWSEADLQTRESTQWPTDKKRAAADFVLNNAGSLAETEHQLEKWCRKKYGEEPFTN